MFSPSSWGHRKWISQKLLDLIFDATEQQNHNEPIQQQTQITSQSMQHTNDCESGDESAGKLAGTTLVCNSDAADSRLYKLYQWANSEIKTCSSVSKRFPKNYYAWTHRRWVCRLLFRMWYNQPDSASTSGSVSTEIKLLFDLLTDELSATQAWSKIHVSDHSAVHYQGQIMRMLLAVGLHPTHGYYCYHNHDQNGNQLHYGYCNTWAWILVNKSIEAARSSSFLAHEVTWIHRRICGFTVLNLMEGYIFGDGGGIGATNDFNGEWSVPFDSTTLSVFLDEFVATEINDVFAVCSTTTNSPERNHALAYIVWMVKKMSESFKERANVVDMMRNALDLLGCDDSIVGNACRIMMNSGKV